MPKDCNKIKAAIWSHLSLNAWRPPFAKYFKTFLLSNQRATVYEEFMRLSKKRCWKKKKNFHSLDPFQNEKTLFRHCRRRQSVWPDWAIFGRSCKQNFTFPSKVATADSCKLSVQLWQKLGNFGKNWATLAKIEQLFIAASGHTDYYSSYSLAPTRIPLFKGTGAILYALSYKYVRKEWEWETESKGMCVIIEGNRDCFAHRWMCRSLCSSSTGSGGQTSTYMLDKACGVIFNENALK